MGAEGWDGKSIRQHVEGAEASAGAARDLAESAHDEIASLRAELSEVREGQVESFDLADTMSANDAAAIKRASLFTKVEFINREIVAWRLFMTEVEAIRALQREWRRLDAQLKGPRE